jgi:hypothetical protein
MTTTYYKFVIKAYASATTGVAVSTIKFYDINNNLITVTSSDVVSQNYDSRNLASNLNQLFVDGEVSPYQPYNSVKSDVTLVVKLVDKDISKIDVRNYTSTAYYTNNVILYKSTDNVNYTQTESITFSSTGEWKSFTSSLSPVIKCLIKNNGQYLSYNGTDFYPVPTSNPTESDYINYGLSDFSSVSLNKWQSLTGDVEISQYTTSVATYREFEIETNQFSLANELGNTPKVIYYTDDPTLTPVLTTGIEVTTLADELGDNPDLLYYTDDPNKTTASMEITANYTPIDELNGDFDIVTWTDEVQSDYTEIKTPTYSQASTGGDLYTTSIDLTKGTGGVKALQ